jgi:O-antigen/teichoic acid export membrane protein
VAESALTDLGDPPEPAHLNRYLTQDLPDSQPQVASAPVAEPAWGLQVMSSVAWSGVAVAFATLAPALASVVVYRALGNAEFAALILVRGLADTLLLYTDAGLSSAVQRFLPVAAGPAGARALLRDVVRLKLALVAALGLVVAIFPTEILTLFGVPAATAATGALLVALVAERNMFVYAQARLTASLQVRRQALNAGLFGPVSAVTMATVAAATHDAESTLLGFLLAETAQSIHLLRGARDPSVAQAGTEPVSRRRVARYVASQIVLKTTRYVQGPAYAALLLGAFAGPQEVARFAVAYLFVNVVIGVAAMPIARLTTALIASAFRVSEQQGRATVRVLTDLNLLTLVPLAASVAVVGVPAIRVLYGSGADAGGFVVALLAVAAALGGVSGVGIAAVQNAEAYRPLGTALIAVAVAAASAVAIGVVVWGAPGAAAGLAFASLLTTAMTASLLARVMRLRPPTWLGVRIAAAVMPLGVLAAMSPIRDGALAGACAAAVGGLLVAYTVFRLTGGIGPSRRAFLEASAHPIARRVARFV